MFDARFYMSGGFSLDQYYSRCYDKNKETLAVP